MPMFRKTCYFLILSGFLFSSCSNHWSVTRRKYTRGYHIEIAGKPNRPSRVNYPASLPAKNDADNEQVIIAQVTAQSSFNEETRSATPPANLFRAPVLKPLPEKVEKNNYPGIQKKATSEKKNAGRNSGVFTMLGQAFGPYLYYAIGSFVVTVLFFLFLLFFEWAVFSGAVAWLLPVIFFLAVVGALVFVVILVLNNE